MASLARDNWSGRGFDIGSAVFPNRKPNTKDNDVAGQERAKENHD